MKIVKKLGVWIDYFLTYLLGIRNNSLEIKTIESGFSIDKKELKSSKTYALLLNKEKHILYDYILKSGNP